MRARAYDPGFQNPIVARIYRPDPCPPEPDGDDDLYDDDNDENDDSHDDATITAKAAAQPVTDGIDQTCFGPSILSVHGITRLCMAWTTLY